MRRKLRYLLAILIYTLFIICNNAVLANGGEHTDFCDLFASNAFCDFNGGNLYGYYLSNAENVSLTVGYNKEVEIPKEYTKDIFDLLNQYKYEKYIGTSPAMNIEFTYRNCLNISLDEFHTEIILCDSGYIYFLTPLYEMLNTMPPVYATACDEKQLCGLIDNLSLYDVDTVKEMNYCGMGNLYVRDSDIENAVCFDKQNILLPLRTTLESIGANIEWDSQNQCVYFRYGDKDYICEIRRPDKYNPQREVLNICENNKYIPTFTVLRDSYININDSIYLHSGAFEDLLSNLGYKISEDLISHSVVIDTIS